MNGLQKTVLTLKQFGFSFLTAMLISLHRYGFVLDTFFCEELESGSSFGRARLGNICIKESPNEDTTFE